MFKSDLGMRLGAVIGTVVLLGGCAAAASTPSASIRGAATTATASGGSGAQETGANLVVLAEGADGGLGLWALDAESRWIALGATPGATALCATSEGVAVAFGHTLDLRAKSDLAHVGTVMTLKWPGVAPAAPIVGLGSSPGKRLAIVTSDEQSLEYALAGADGAVTALSPQPTQTFKPLVDWLDEARLLVLSTDNQQVSRIAVLDTVAHTLMPSAAVLGVTLFAISSDRQVVTLAAEDAIYALPASTLLGQASPQAVGHVAEFDVVWTLALNADGSRLFAFSGTVASDGTVSSFHGLGYAKGASGWVRTLDVPAPFKAIVGQVYLA
jgi:hypothetical protein